MLVQFGQVRNKEMVCIKDGMRIGYVDDIEFDNETYQITSLISYGKGKFFGLLGKYDDIKIQKDQIEVVGEDIILVRDYLREGQIKTRKSGLWSSLFE